MSILVFTLLLMLGSVAAGTLGALTGLGGGIVIVPLLTVGFHVDLRYAIGASLVSVIATSSAAAATYVRDGYANVRIGMLLEVATTIGALVGAFVAGWISPNTIAILFGVVLLYSALHTAHAAPEVATEGAPDSLGARLRLDSTYPTPEGERRYFVQRVPLGFALMLVAGVVSGLLGIGSGALKVLAMDRAMRLPFKVSTTTSNFMIGVTAAASAGVYLQRGYLDPGIAMPVMLGVLLGASLGARLLMRVRVKVLRFVFSLITVALALQMLYKGIAGSL